MCCHIIVRPGKRAEFDAWAEKEAPALVGAWGIMLDKNGDLLLIRKMDPFARQGTEQLEQSVLKYAIATTAAADEVTDEFEERGPGSGLPEDQAHPSYCLFRTRRALIRHTCSRIPASSSICRSVLHINVQSTTSSAKVSSDAQTRCGVLLFNFEQTVSSLAVRCTY